MDDRDLTPFDQQGTGLFEPDTVLPLQYFDRLRRRHVLIGEHRLMFAILEDAIRIYCKENGARSRGGRRAFREAKEWIESTDCNWVFSFERICDALDLEPGYIRRGVRAWKSRALEGQRAMVISLLAASREEQPLQVASG
jgi:hypothetical protein